MSLSVYVLSDIRMRGITSGGGKSQSNTRLEEHCERESKVITQLIQKSD
jgi:hypothetical protein